MDKELNKLRQKIDLLDDKILSSILERAKIVDSVAKIKGVEGVEIIRPGREINLLEKLYKKANNHLDGKSIIYIWREIISTITNSVQSSFEIIVSDKIDSELGEEVRNYYGSRTKKTFNYDNSKALKVISQSKNIVAVLTCGDDWWLKPLPKNIYVFASLPILDGKHFGFILGQVKPEKAKNNKTLVVCNTNNKSSVQDYNPEIIATKKDNHLLSINGFYKEIDIKNISILGSFGYIDIE